MNGATHAAQLAANIGRFAQLLRRAGLPVGLGRTLAAVEAATCVGVASRTDFRAALAATLLDRPDQRPLFDRAFALFWDAARAAAPTLDLPPDAQARAKRPSRPADTGAGAALRSIPADAADGADAEPVAAASLSARELLRRRDFAAMTLQEREEAKRLIAALDLPLPAVPTRRYGPDPHGDKLDLRRTLRRSLRHGGEWLAPCRRRKRSRSPTLVALCDISGSMADYSRMLLHFLHALARRRPRVYAFAFGTRLTPITRAVRLREVDRALAAAAREVSDWSGGTRIGACLRVFNRQWARRLLGSDAVVLLISDGLDAGEGPELAAQIERLRKACRTLVWLNPLLRYAGFEPRAAGIRTIMPYVDVLVPAHSVASLAGLGAALRDLESCEISPGGKTELPGAGTRRTRFGLDRSRQAGRKADEPTETARWK